MFGMGWGTPGEVQDGSGDYWGGSERVREVKDGLGDNQGGP